MPPSTIKSDEGPVDAAIVVVAEAHNPTLLHREFLARHSIVPEDWTTDDDKTVCSLPFSSVTFHNGVTIQADHKRLTFRHQLGSSDAPVDVIANIATDYIIALPEVRYTAIGINFTSLTPIVDPSHWMLERFITRGPWRDDAALSPSGVGVKLVYPDGGGLVSFMIDPGQWQARNGPEQVGIITKANFHIDIPTNLPNPAIRAKAAIREFARHREQLATFLPILIGEIPR